MEWDKVYGALININNRHCLETTTRIFQLSTRNSECRAAEQKMDYDPDNLSVTGSTLMNLSAIHRSYSEYDCDDLSELDSDCQPLFNLIVAIDHGCIGEFRDELSKTIPTRNLYQVSSGNHILLSHINALCIALERQENALIVHDAFKFNVSAEMFVEMESDIIETFGDDWNVIVLTNRVDNIDGMVVLQDAKVSSFATGAYIVNKNYITTLLDLWITQLCEEEDPYHLRITDFWIGYEHGIGSVIDLSKIVSSNRNQLSRQTRHR
jgi:hypothetical protein